MRNLFAPLATLAASAAAWYATTDLRVTDPGGYTPDDAVFLTTSNPTAAVGLGACVLTIVGMAGLAKSLGFQLRDPKTHDHRVTAALAAILFALGGGALGMLAPVNIAERTATLTGHFMPQ
ncbi:MAG: hypothetical protein AB7G06_08075 [Bdellovibrionales bacterium]